MRQFVLFTVGGLAAVLGGCSTAPVARPAAGARQPVVASTAASAVAAAPAPAVDGARASAAGATARGNVPPAAAAGGTAAPAVGATAPVDAASRPVNRALISQGYRPTTYHGQLLYCRFEKLTGSQFSHKVCLTEQEAALQERIAQDEMMKRNSQGKCVQPLCDK
ncbi:MAG TPA: hypothetical protein VNO35_16250 [Steroidobacteraceae bacterium]|nr:hypothetical protein [Steroidobacteraceae bacterium]